MYKYTLFIGLMILMTSCTAQNKNKINQNEFSESGISQSGEVYGNGFGSR